MTMNDTWVSNGTTITGNRDGNHHNLIDIASKGVIIY